jgi:hypothetical protein
VRVTPIFASECRCSYVLNRGATITVRNVGKGPALNIAIARGGQELASRDALDLRLEDLSGTSWSNAVHVRPIEAGGQAVYNWAGVR